MRTGYNIVVQGERKSQWQRDVVLSVLAIKWLLLLCCSVWQGIGVGWGNSKNRSLLSIHLPSLQHGTLCALSNFFMGAKLTLFCSICCCSSFIIYLFFAWIDAQVTVAHWSTETRCAIIHKYCLAMLCFSSMQRSPSLPSLCLPCVCLPICAANVQYNQAWPEKFQISFTLVFSLPQKCRTKWSRKWSAFGRMIAWLRIRRMYAMCAQHEQRTAGPSVCSPAEHRRIVWCRDTRTIKWTANQGRRK